MHDDEELRTRLLRERADRGRAQGAGNVLNELRPAMRRARRRRIAATTAAVTAAVTVGLAGAAQVVRVDRNDTFRVASDNSSTDLAPVAPIDQSDDDQSDDGQSENGQSGDSSTIAAPLHDDTALDDPVASVPVTHHDEIEQPHVDSQPLETDASDADEQPSPATTIVKSATGQPITASSTPTTSTDPPAPSTTAATTTTVDDQPQPERFDSACGWVLALRSSTSVELIEIHPEPGYDARPEDPDQGNTTVQFTGPGEDCELKITVSGTPPHDD